MIHRIEKVGEVKWSVEILIFCKISLQKYYEKYKIKIIFWK